MSLSRRKTLAILGGGLVLAATAGAGFAVTRAPESALAPWAQAGRHADPRLNALSWAILAPNPHNRQPWLVDLSVAEEVTLRVDLDRLLPHTDPYSRQIVIGLGCFLDLMRMAAAEEGFSLDVTLFPEGWDPAQLDDRAIAVVRLVADAGVARDPLFAQVPERRTLKDPFDVTRPVAAETVAALVEAVTAGSLAGGSVDPADIDAFRDLTHRALRIEVETPHTYKESVDLFRIGRAEVDANPDGIDFSGPMFETLALTGLMTREAALDTSSFVFTSGMAAVLENCDTAMGHVWLVTPGNTREEQIMAGRDWLRLNLAATALGLGVQPLSQALQEYPEMAGPYEDIHRRLAPEGGVVQMFARVGYGARPAPSPRWPVEAKVVNGA
jgi:hypothetical protein